MPRVLNKHTDIIPPDAVYVGWPSKWGNPWSIKDWTVRGHIKYSREEVIQLFREYLNYHPELIQKAKQELAGKDLVCWCAPLPCHADILLELVNEVKSVQDTA